MKLTPTLTTQQVENRVREVGINPNYWYPVAWAKDLKPSQVIPVVIWQEKIALYRDDENKVYALEDACPHKGVALHIPYHGWEFNGEGECVRIPYLPQEQKLPCAKARSYPVQEKYGLIWVFPGEPHLATTKQPPEVPEYEDSNWLAVPIPAYFKAHFSICNENTMDLTLPALKRRGFVKSPQSNSYRRSQSAATDSFKTES